LKLKYYIDKSHSRTQQLQKRDNRRRWWWFWRGENGESFSGKEKSQWRFFMFLREIWRRGYE